MKRNIDNVDASERSESLWILFYSCSQFIIIYLSLFNVRHFCSMPCFCYLWLLRLKQGFTLYAVHYALQTTLVTEILHSHI